MLEPGETRVGPVEGAEQQPVGHGHELDELGSLMA